MNKPAMAMTQSAVQSATEIAKQAVQAALRTAADLKDDPRAHERSVAGLCLWCFYRPPRIAGAAFTSRPCMSCSQVQTYSSTATDVLCLPCAHAHELCKRCGGDRNLELRTTWPAAYRRPDEGDEA